MRVLGPVLVVTYFTRPTARRFAGALAGGAASGFVVLGAIVIGNTTGLWRVPFASTPYFLPLVYLVVVVSNIPTYLLTWRVARRFGWRGLLAFVAGAALIGPPRDYRFAAAFPEWMVIAPVIGIAITYAALVAVGHAFLRLVARSCHRRSVGVTCAWTSREDWHILLTQVELPRCAL